MIGDTTRPQVVGDKLVVRVRPDRSPMGPFTLVLYVLTHPHGRRRIGPRHFTAQDARAYGEAQGWLVIGAPR
jgi:hypothetical protein